MRLDTSIYTEFDSRSILKIKMDKNIKQVVIFQNIHENFNRKVDSISARVPEYDFEGPRPQKPWKKQFVYMFFMI